MSETDKAKKRGDMTFPRRWTAAMLFLVALACSAILPNQIMAQEATASEPAPSNLDLLLDVIENDDSRAALIDELRAAQSEADAPVDDQIVETLAADGATPPEALSFSRRIALITQEAAQDIASGLENAWTQIARAPMAPIVEHRLHAQRVSQQRLHRAGERAVVHVHVRHLMIRQREDFARTRIEQLPAQFFFDGQPPLLAEKAVEMNGTIHFCDAIF